MSTYSNKANAATVLQAVGLLLVMAGLAMPILTGGWDGTAFKYVYSAGAVITLVSRLIAPAYKGDNLRLKRLVRLQSWSAIFYCVAAFFLFYAGGSMRDWIAFTLAGAAVQIISSVMIGLALRKK